MLLNLTTGSLCSAPLGAAASCVFRQAPSFRLAACVFSALIHYDCVENLRKRYGKKRRKRSGKLNDTENTRGIMAL